MRAFAKSALLVGGAILAALLIGSGGRPAVGPPAGTSQLEVCPERRSVTLGGRVLQDRGWVQFLLYAPGYEWLSDESAIELEVDLRRLQLALASLDWRIWDRLWAQGEDVPGIEMEIAHGDRRWPAGDLLAAEAGNVGFRHLLFPGSPYFDALALRAGGPPCVLCPLFPMEQAMLSERFVRPDGRSGYELRAGALPAPGTRVRVTIILPAP
ncbi:MAG TPA: hypothetical protein VLK32_06410 [Bacillota bacterium]|nr:hypothetical protein [Bacillota bacterium]